MLNKTLLRFGAPLPLVAAAAALVIWYLLSPADDAAAVPFLFLLLPVAVSAWVGGAAGGLWATLLAAIVGEYFFVTPGSLLLTDNSREQNLSLLIFALEGAAASWLIAAVRASRLRSDERRQATEQSEDRLRLLAESAGDAAFYQLDAQGRVAACDAGAERLDGYRAQEIKGEMIARLYPPSDVDRKIVDDALGLARREGRAELEGWRVRRDGSRYWARAVFTALKDEAGHPRGFAHVARDAGERKRSAEALRESEARFLTLADAAPVMMWMTGPRREFTFFNKGWFDFTGRTIKQEQGEGWAASIHPQDLRAYLAAFEKAFERRERFRMEFRLRRQDGEYRWVLADGVPRAAEGGEFAGYIGVCEDITERRQSEQERESLLRELADQRGRLEAVLRQMPAGVLIAEAPSGKVILSNDQMDQIWRYSPQLSDRAKLTLEYKGFHPSGQAYQLEEWPLLRSIRSGETVTDEEIDFERGDNSRGTMLVSSSPVRDADREIIAAVATFYDVTERKTAERERAQLYARERMARREAETANRAKDEFLATLSHELRTPLTSILGWVRMLRAGHLDEANFARALETIQRSAQSQAHLVDELLDVSRVVTGKLRLETKPVSLTPIIESALDTVRPTAEAKSIELLASIEKGDHYVSGDSDRLHQIFWNILANAIKFTPKGGRVTIEVGGDDSNAEIVVSDNGIGIKKEMLPHVFERFRQGDSSMTRAYAGLGLGLAIARHLVELHGGTVSAESPGPGAGSTFRVTLPMVEPPPKEATSGGADRAAGDGAPSFEEGGYEITDLKGMHVLVVDDEAETLRLLTTVLQKYGARVTFAASAAEAFERLKAERPDVLVSDIQMPGESGYDLIAKVRSLGAEQGGATPAAALTAYAGAEDRMRALLAGFQIHVPKPVEPAELAAVVATLVGRNIRV